MKKILVILIGLIGFGIGANAQTCKIPGTEESISITQKQKLKSVHNVTGCECHPDAGYRLTVENPSTKKVSFKITALNPKNINETVVFCSIDGNKGYSTPVKYVCFIANNDDYSIEDYKIEVTSCSD
jgi:hypothetical protein